jgi:hypothetical protein
MFFTEFAWGYALKKGEITKDAVVTDMTLQMVHQMIGLINAHLEFPQEFDSPIHRIAGKKHNQ